MTWKKLKQGESLQDGVEYRITTISTGIQGDSDTYRSETVYEVKPPPLPTTPGSIVKGRPPYATMSSDDLATYVLTTDCWVCLEDSGHYLKDEDPVDYEIIYKAPEGLVN